MGEILRHVLVVLPAFLLACLAVAALPGPSTALFLHRTVRDGRAAGLAAVAGNEIGVFCWALAAGAGLTGLLWGGAVRMLVLHHSTYSINSLCHFFGRKTFDTGDESRNLYWLSVFTFGEAYHNNHHAFPTSARHGLSRWSFDPSAWVIWALEKTGLAWDVVRVSPERQSAKLAT